MQRHLVGAGVEQDGQAAYGRRPRQGLPAGAATRQAEVRIAADGMQVVEGSRDNRRLLVVLAV
jgi:hypothetical protein